MPSVFALAATVFAFGATTPPLSQPTQPSSSVESTPLREKLRDKYRGRPDAQGVTCTMLIQMSVVQGEFWLQKAEVFNNITGATVLIEYDKSRDIRMTSLSDATGPGFYCSYMQQANNLPDMAKHDAVLDLTARVQKHKDLDWFDIFPGVREVVSYRLAGHEHDSVFGIPLDGDVIMMAYRADLLETAGFAIPRTWEEFATISDYFAERDINFDGQPDFGACFRTSMRDAHTPFWAIVAPYLQTEGRSQGIFFDMESLMPKSSKPEFVNALRMWKRLVLTSPYRDLGPISAGQSRNLMAEGRCALMLDFPKSITTAIYSGISALVISNQTERGDPNGRLQVHRLPGVACTEIQHMQSLGFSRTGAVSADLCADQTTPLITSCPFAVNGVNYAPLYAGGGLAASVRKSAIAIHQDIAFDFWMFVADPAISYLDVARLDGGLDPYRNRHVEPLNNLSSVEAQAYIQSSWSPEQIRSLRAETKFVFETENGVRDLSIQGYYPYVHDATLPTLFEYLQDQKDEATTQLEITRKWKEVTRRFTLQGQRNEYRRTLGLGPYDEPSGDSLTLLIYIPPFVLGFGLLGLLVYAGRRVYHRLKQQAALAKEQVRLKHKRVRDASNLITSVPFPMVFIKLSDFKSLRRLVPFEVARQKGLQFYMDDFDAITHFCRKHPTCFISHQWLGFSEPDSDNQHFPAICTAAEQLCENAGVVPDELYLWLDYSCIAQQNETLKSLCISAIGMYACVVRYFIVVAPPARHRELGTICNAETYSKRGWCRLEQWARMTAGGLADMHVFTGDSLESACLTPMCGLKEQSARLSRADLTGASATEAINDWVTESICVFEGEFSNVEDKVKLVDIVLGLWFIALQSDTRGARAEEARERRVILDAIEANKARVFPAEIFGDLVEVLEQHAMH